MTLRMSPGRRSAEKRWTIPEMLAAAITTPLASRTGAPRAQACNVTSSQLTE